MNTILAKTQIPLLLISGALLILVGVMILVAPVDFYASNNIALDSDVSLLNELKAPAGFLLVAGGFMIGAIFVKSMITMALLLATMIYLSYATSRFASMWFDGVPAEGLVQAAALGSRCRPSVPCGAVDASDSGKESRVMDSALMTLLLTIAAIGAGLMAGIYFAFSSFIMRSLDRLGAANAADAMNAINEVILRSWFHTTVLRYVFIIRVAGCASPF